MKKELLDFLITKGFGKSTIDSSLLKAIVEFIELKSNNSTRHSERRADGSNRKAKEVCCDTCYYVSRPNNICSDCEEYNMYKSAN